jgi:hypothetical protein
MLGGHRSGRQRSAGCGRLVAVMSNRTTEIGKERSMLPRAINASERERTLSLPAVWPHDRST